MRDHDCVLLSGASGAIGAFLARELVRLGQAPVICLLRGEASMRRLAAAVGPDVANRVVPVYADLTIEAQVQAAAKVIGSRERCLAVHCAAEISWTKSERLAAPINIDGTRRFAELAVGVSRRRPSLILFSTAFCDDSHEPRNAYELTKRAAERLLIAEFAARANLAIIKCSLVVGSTSDGWMARFNGLYPLIKVLALAEVPCLIAEPHYHVDTTPVDFVWRLVQAAAGRLGQAGPPLRLVAASGAKALSIGDVARMTVERVDKVRRDAGLPSLPEISILAERQFRFLMSASKSWNLDRRFAKVEEISRVMAGYIAHGGSGRDLEPVILDEEVPDPKDYLPGVIDYWISANSSRVLRPLDPEWLNPPSEAVA